MKNRGCNTSLDAIGIPLLYSTFFVFKVIHDDDDALVLGVLSLTPLCKRTLMCKISYFELDSLPLAFMTQLHCPFPGNHYGTKGGSRRGILFD
jgi:hypothetical protein